METQKKVKISIVNSVEKAQKVVDFFNSKASFDDRNFTPGELEHMKTCTFDSLNDKLFFYWYAENEEGEVVGTLGVKANPQMSGGFTGDYCVVHRDYRHNGLAKEMHYVMFSHLKSIGARYMLIETGDTPHYKAIRALLTYLGFEQVGHCPDYYFPGEGLLWYLKKF